MPIIRDKTTEDISPISLSDKHYSLGRDDGESLLNRIATDYIRKRGKYENNTGPTAQVLKELTSEPSWWEKVGQALEFTERQDKIYLCRIISDHRTSCLPEPVSLDDNIMDLSYPKFVLSKDSPEVKESLAAGSIVRVRMDDNHTMFASYVAGTIEQVLDKTATIEQTSQNCNIDIPKEGGEARTNVENCTSSVPKSGRSIKFASTKPPRPERGEFPKSPITGLRAEASSGNRSLSPAEREARIGTINSGFPTRNSSPDPHKGIDLRTLVNGQISTGAPIKAALDGTAITGVLNGYGYVVAIKHTAYKANTKDSTFWTLYAHLLPGGRVRGPVKAGQEIGKSGNSSGLNSYESTPHLHFEVIYENDPSWTTVNQVITGGAVDPVQDFFFNKFERK